MLNKLKALKAAIPRIEPQQSSPVSSSPIEMQVIRESKKMDNSPTVLVINGFLSGKGNDISDWLEVVDALYPNNKVIHVKWKAGNLNDLMLDNGLIKMIPDVTTQDSLIKKLGVVGFVAINKVSGHWRKAFTETEVVGIALADLIEHDPELEGCILMGHSLGARIISHTMDKLIVTKVSKCYLLAGAVSSNSNIWDSIIERHQSTTFINCMSNLDTVLKYAYKIGTLSRDVPIGLQPILYEENPSIINLDVTHIAQKHTLFKTKEMGVFLNQNS